MDLYVYIYIRDEQDNKIAGAAVQHEKRKKGSHGWNNLQSLIIVCILSDFKPNWLKKTVDKKKKKVISSFIIEQFLKWLNKLVLVCKFWCLKFSLHFNLLSCISRCAAFYSEIQYRFYISPIFGHQKNILMCTMYYKVWRSDSDETDEFVLR